MEIDWRDVHFLFCFREINKSDRGHRESRLASVFVEFDHDKLQALVMLTDHVAWLTVVATVIIELGCDGDRMISATSPKYFYLSTSVRPSVHRLVHYTSVSVCSAVGPEDDRPSREGGTSHTINRVAFNM